MSLRLMPAASRSLIIDPLVLRRLIIGYLLVTGNGAA
jgi:hypothetical protein